MPGDRLRNQAEGTAQNARDFVGSTGADDFLPSGMRSFGQELLYLIPHALGRGTPRQQITSSVILGILAVLATPISFTYSLFLLIPLSLTFIMGVYRFVPAINSTWKGSRARDVVKKDRDVPGWRRD